MQPLFQPVFQRMLLTAMVSGLVSPALAQVQFEHAAKHQMPADTDRTYAFACADLDGDGAADLVVGNDGQQNRILINDGSGRFTDQTAARLPTVTDRTLALATGDLNGDGNPDIVVGNFQQQNRLYLNNGMGQFIEVTATQLPVDTDRTNSLALADVDGDGDLDLLVGNTFQNRLYLNDGSARFQDATTTHLPFDASSTHALAFGDIDRDGNLDFIAGNGGEQNRLYMNVGSGRFTDATTGRMPTLVDWTESIALVDVNGDGYLDFVAANSLRQQNRLYLNNGSGVFTDVTTLSLPSDTDASFAMVVGDMDGDGDTDILFGNLDGLNPYGARNRLYVNDGSGRFSDATAARLPVATANSRALATADVDGEGHLDLVIGNVVGRNLLYLNDGSGTFSNATAHRLPVDGEWTTSIASGDLDGDGYADAVLGRYEQQNRLYLNDGTGGFTDATAGRMPIDADSTQCLGLGDVDGDGDLDIVVGNGPVVPGQQNRLYLNDGTGRFTDATQARLPLQSDNTRALALLDVDRDGDVDILFMGYSAHDGLCLNDGTGRFQLAPSQFPRVSLAVESIATGDVEGDGDLDIVLGTEFHAQNLLILNDGTGRFTDATAGRMPVDVHRTTAIALSDVDGDGAPDIVIGNGYVPNQLYLNDGTGRFRDATATHMPPDTDRTESVVCLDVNDDGFLDILVGNHLSRNRVYINDGTGRFVDETQARLPPDQDRTNVITVVDVDGDGDLDFFTGNDGQNRLFHNLRRQLSAPFLLRIGHSYALEIHARHPPAGSVDVAVPHLATSTTNVPLPGLGRLRIDPASHVRLPAMIIPQPFGKVSLQLQIPDDPTLLGLPVHTQAVIVELPGQVRLTNLNSDLIQR